MCSIRICFLFFFFFLFFSRYFLWQTLTIYKIAGNGEEIITLLVFHFHTLTNIQLVHLDFYHFFLVDIFAITRLIAIENCWWAFLLMKLSRSYWLYYFKVTLWEFELISNYHPPITKRTAEPSEIKTNYHLYYLSHLPNPTPSHHLSSSCFSKYIRNEGCFTFYMRFEEE